MSIVGIAGSLRRGSYNQMRLRAAADVMPEGVSLEIASIRDIPLYDADVEADHGLPEPVQQLKQRIAAADGLLIATPGTADGLRIYTEGFAAFVQQRRRSRP